MEGDEFVELLRRLDDEEMMEYMLYLCDVVGAQQDANRWRLVERLLMATETERLTALRKVRGDII